MTVPSADLPRLKLVHAPQRWDVQGELSALDWSGVPALGPFVLANGSGLASQQTLTRVCADRRCLYVRFDCQDADIWATHTQRDQPLYNEEVVEVFLAPGAANPLDYYEFEISPDGVLFDARIHNPTDRRADIGVDTRWDCAGARWLAVRDDAVQRWWAILAIPWAALAPAAAVPAVWRANFYRIERPRQAIPEFSGWSPTYTDPADFHKPAYFGTLTIEEPGVLQCSS